MTPQGGGLRPPPGGSLHSLATEKFEFRVIALERDFFDFLEICSKPGILYFPDPRGASAWIWRPQREDLDLAASAGNNNYYNQRFRWQEPPGKIMFVLFCFATCRDEEKETQNINVVGTTQNTFRLFGIV